jgi:hypothetical protein
MVSDRGRQRLDVCLRRADLIEVLARRKQQQLGVIEAALARVPGVTGAQVVARHSEYVANDSKHVLVVYLTLDAAFDHDVVCHLAREALQQQKRLMWLLATIDVMPDRAKLEREGSGFGVEIGGVLV